MSWKSIDKPPKNQSMVLVVRDFNGEYMRDYSYYNDGRFEYPYFCFDDDFDDEPYNNVILWRYLPKLPKELINKEL